MRAPVCAHSGGDVRKSGDCSPRRSELSNLPDIFIFLRLLSSCIFHRFVPVFWGGSACGGFHQRKSPTNALNMIIEFEIHESTIEAPPESVSSFATGQGPPVCVVRMFALSRLILMS